MVFMTKGFALTNTVNVSIALSTSIFWGYLFDILIYDKVIDFSSIIGAFLVVVGSLINI